MVWSVCRRLLLHHDAEDAFQATFLVLVRKAAAIVPRDMLANWLYGVAHQTALHARRTAARRRARERQVTAIADPAVTEQEVWRDLQPLLDQELSRLPDNYRVAIVLCDLEGKTRRDAARQLGCPEGTLAARLARARVMLAKRLARHGLAVSAGALAAEMSQKAASAVVPTSVVSGTIKAAILVAAGQTVAAGAISEVAALTEGVLKTMLITKLKITTAVLLAVSIIGFSTTVITYRTLASEQSIATNDAGHKPGGKASLVQGKADTIEVPPEAQVAFGIQFGLIKARGEAPPVRLKMTGVMTGVLNYDNDRLFVLHARFPGELVEVRQVMDTNDPKSPPRERPMRNGDKVKQGDLLAVLWSKELGTAKVALVDAVRAVRQCQTDLTHYEGIMNAGLGSEARQKSYQRRLEAEKTTLQTAECSLRMWKLTDMEIDDIKAEASKLVDEKKKPNAKDDVKWARVEIRVPVFDKADPNREMVVMEKNANVGDILEPGKSPPLFKVADISRLEIRAHPPDDYLPFLREALRKEEGLPWDISIHAYAPSTSPLKLNVRGLMPTLEQPTPTLVGYLPNREGKYLVGLTATATIRIPATQRELAIPASALVEEGAKAYVLVQPDPRKYQFALRPVRIVRRDRDVAHIISSSTPGQQAEGVQALRPGARVITAGAVELKALLVDLKQMRR